MSNDGFNTGYEIRHGSIAAIQRIVAPNTSQFTAIYMSADKPPEIHEQGSSKDVWAEFPAFVQDAIKAQFDRVFALPVEKREAWIWAQYPMQLQG